MMKSFTTLLRYWVSGEDSRLGRQDYWNHVVLAGKPRHVRFFWELSKTAFVLSLCFYVYLGLMLLL